MSSVRGPRISQNRLKFTLLAAGLVLSSCRPVRVSTPATAIIPPEAVATLSAPVSASAIAIDPSGQHLAAVNPDSGSISLVDGLGQGTPSVSREVRVGADPRTLSFTPDGVQVLAADYGSGTLTFVSVATGQVEAQINVGSRPYGIVAGTSRAYVSLAGRPEVVVLDLAARTILARVPVADFPTGLALARDQASLYVTHLHMGTITIIDTAADKVRQTVAGDAHATPGVSQSIALSPNGTRAYAPRTDSLAEQPHLTYQTTVRPEVSVLDTSKAQFLPSQRIDLAQAGRQVNLPFAAVVSPDGGTLYVANAGSDDISAIDTLTGRARAHLLTGRNPRGLALSPDGGRLFVDNVLDGTLDVFDTQSFTRVATLTLTHIPLAPDVLAGKRLFNSALPPMAAAPWLSCATCHLDGGADGRTWAGFPDGPRNTPALFGARDTLPLHWNGNLDEFQDTELTIRAIQGGAGLIDGQPSAALGPPNTGRSAALDSLAAYLASLTQAPSPYAPASAEEAAAVQRGQYSFQRWGCAVCHAAPPYTDRHLHISGIGDPALERNQPGPLPRFDTPSLLGDWATAPYFHDGSAATLRDVLFSRDFHNMGPAMNEGEPDDLVAYLKSLP
jgi:YVTN family beta-propeller protein